MGLKESRSRFVPQLARVLVVLCGLVALTSGVRAQAPVRSETTLPEEALYREMLHGDVAAARAGFAKLLEQRLAVLESHSEASIDSPAQLLQHAAGLEGAVRALESWQAAELEERFRGRPTPEAELQELVAALEPIQAQAERIQRSARPLIST